MQEKKAADWLLSPQHVYWGNSTHKTRNHKITRYMTMCGVAGDVYPARPEGRRRMSSLGEVTRPLHFQDDPEWE